MDTLLNFNNSDRLEHLLSQPPPSLEDILDQENVVNEVKSNNARLITYFLECNVFDRLISYVSEIQLDAAQQSAQSLRELKLTKFPYVACEILSAGNEKLAKKFFGLKLNEDKPSESSTTEELNTSTEQLPKNDIGLPISKFLNFLDSPGPIDFTLAGYFCKVLKQLFQSEPKSIAELLFGNSSSYLKKMVIHSYSDSIQDLLLSVLKLDSAHFRLNPGEYYISQRIELIEQLIMCLHEKSASNSDDLHFDRQMNCSIILSAVLSSSGCFPNGKAVVTPILTPETLRKNIQGLLEPSLTKPLTPLVQELCYYYKNMYGSIDKLPLLDLINFTECVIPLEIPHTEPFLLEISASLEGIFNILKPQKAQPAEKVDVCISINPNQRKVSLCEVVFSFIKLQSTMIDEKIVETGGIVVLLEMFSNNPWNNILHAALNKLFTFILEYGSDVLNQALFEQANVLDYIMQEAQNPDTDVPSGKQTKTKKSYLSYLDMLSNKIEAAKNEFIIYFRNNHETWRKYREEWLEKERAKPIFEYEKAPLSLNIKLKDEEDRWEGGNHAGSPPANPNAEKTEKPSLGVKTEIIQENNDWEADPEMTPKASKNSGWDEF